MSTEKHCSSCSDQTGGRTTPHSIKDGKWKCGLCGHETPKRAYTSKKSKQLDALMKSLHTEAADPVLKPGKTVFVTKQNPKISNTPTQGKIHSVGKDHVTLKTVGGTGLYKVHKDDISHNRHDNWMHKKYQKEEAPVNSAGGGNIAGIGVGAKGEPGVKPAAMSKYKKKNQAEAPSPVVGPTLRRSFKQFIQGK